MLNEVKHLHVNRARPSPALARYRAQRGASVATLTPYPPQSGGGALGGGDSVEAPKAQSRHVVNELC
jgi:hypothetical protein